MLKDFYRNTKKPRSDFGGRLIIKIMNKGHKKMADWARSNFQINADDTGLDIGCGGGQNLKDQIKLCKKMYGIDYSNQSVEFSIKHNKKDVDENKIEITRADVSKIPFEDEKFDFVTAYETIYFWPDLENDFKEVFRVLKPGGRFMIANELKNPEAGKKWIDMIGFDILMPDKIKELLISAGFASVDIIEHENGDWILFYGVKQ
ncbi:MAG: class I SAM-dependent methyltransferase [Tissierellia bacterium]|nr:class I SAM-dependent methyltransferase [Tissierellia bacterium]